MAIEPTKKDLDPNHPLFVAMSTRNVFQRVWNEKGKKDGGGDHKPPAKKRRVQTKNDATSAQTKEDSADALPLASLFGMSSKARPALCWVEVLCECTTGKSSIGSPNKKKPKMHWIQVDPYHTLVNEPDMVEAMLYAERLGLPLKQVKKKVPILYALAAEHVEVRGGECKLRLTDVTPRYSSSWTASLKARGVLRGKQTKIDESQRVDKWWSNVRKSVNAGSHSRQKELQAKGKQASDAIVLDDDSNDEDKKPAAKDTTHHLEEVDNHEKEELKASAKQEPIPTSKTAFKSHPLYVIRSVLNQTEVLVPDARKRICGIFKGEPVFKRTDVETALPAKRWLYRGRKVKPSEIKKPVLRVKARKRATKGFQQLKSYGIGEGNDGSEEARAKIIAEASKPLDDDKQDLFASWQTDPWSPAPVGQTDPIPVNEHNNVELELLNPGLVHIEQPKISKVAKQLGMYVCR